MTARLGAREILERLVSFPTISDVSNVPLIDWVQGYLEEHGIAVTRVSDDAAGKAGLYAQVGPDVPGGIVLSGHTDVVPVEGQDWSSDPWTLTEREGRLFARGACDMKGFDALAIAALVAARDRPLVRPLQIALSWDEEIGCLGAPRLIDKMRATLPPAAAVIVGEPSMMQVVTGHKGCARLLVTVTGYEVHSSLMHTGVSAVMLAARLIDWCRRMTEENRARAPEPQAALFDPPFTTLHVGQIAGGTAHNITARECRFGIDLRTVPTEKTADWIARVRAEAARLEAEAQALRPEARVEVELHSDTPGLTPEKDGAAEALARRLTGDNGTHVVSYGTEAGQFQERGYSVAICGPGDIAQAHQADEYVSVAQIEAGERFVSKLIEDLVS